MQDLGQPRFHVSSRVELFMGSESPNKSLLNEILGIDRIFCQMKCHPIQMIKVNHGLTGESVLLGAPCFSIP
jgi:hypothetical protein